MIKNTIIAVLALILISAAGKAQSVELYFGLADNDGVQCKFGDVEGCRLFPIIPKPHNG